MKTGDSLNIEEYMSKNTFIGIMGIAGILMLIGFFLPWAGAGTLAVKGFEYSKAPLVFIGGWIAIIGAMIGFDLFNSSSLEDLKPMADTGLGLVGGILSLIGIVAFLNQKSSILSSSWGIYVITVGIVLAFISAIIMYFISEEKFHGRGPRSKSGGL